MFISAAFCLSVKVKHPKLFCSVALFVNEVPQRWLLFKVCTINAIIIYRTYKSALTYASLCWLILFRILYLFGDAIRDTLRLLSSKIAGMFIE